MVWPKWYTNQQLRTAYEQKFTYYGYDYRMSLIQIRQVRSGGKHLKYIHYISFGKMKPYFIVNLFSTFPVKRK